MDQPMVHISGFRMDFAGIDERLRFLVVRLAVGHDGDALIADEESYSVRVIEGDQVRQRAVTLGRMNDHEVVVASGLQPGEVVQRHVAQ